MKVVLDTSSLIYLSDFRKFDEILTVDKVIEEVKDRITALKLSGLTLEIIEPSKKNIEEIRKTAKVTGDLENLSDTDIEILALAKEKNCTIISDDRSIQNVAEKLGINYISIFSKKITKLITWKKYCKNCEKFYERGKECPVCGSKLTRMPAKAVKIKSK